MTAKTKKVALYTLAGVLSLTFAVAATYFLAVGTATVWNKKQLADGSLRIIATVTEVDKSFHFARGGDGVHSISYTFTYMDSSGKVRKATRTNFALASGDSQAYKVGAQIVVSYLVANPDINEPTQAIGKMSASFVFVAHMISGLVTVAIVYFVLWRRFPQLLRYGQGIVRVLVTVAGLVATFAIGVVLGNYLVRVIEGFLL